MIALSTLDTPYAPPMTERQEMATRWIGALHDEVTACFAALDGSQPFRDTRWTRAGGGGGVSRALLDGETFEKAGINRSAVHGPLPAAVHAPLGGRSHGDEPLSFFAPGVSLVVHPRNPLVPTVHLNVRYVELTDAAGELRDAWFGGGTDLTPTYPSPDDARAFHRALRAVCDAHHATLYPRFKASCDAYFRNAHRGGEARGVGGIFFDHLRPNEDPSALDRDGLFAFAGDVGRSLAQAYAPIVRLRRRAPYGDRERQLQLRRRGRYVEFNLLHDRGTLFGLQTGARIESVLMSLPPVATWGGVPGEPPDGAPDSLDAALHAMLVPRDWAGEDD